jgi:hypothetical protein
MTLRNYPTSRIFRESLLQITGANSRGNEWGTRKSPMYHEPDIKRICFVYEKMPQKKPFHISTKDTQRIYNGPYPFFGLFSGYDKDTKLSNGGEMHFVSALPANSFIPYPSCVRLL